MLPFSSASNKWSSSSDAFTNNSNESNNDDVAIKTIFTLDPDGYYDDKCNDDVQNDFVDDDRAKNRQ